MKAVSEKFSATLTIKHKNRTKGKFMTYRKVAKELGWDWEGAKNYCLSCIQDGPTEYFLDGH